MAISLLSAHIANNDHVPASLPIIFKLDSDDIDIKKISLDVEDDAANVLQTLVKSPDIGTTDEFTFDLSNVIQDNLGFETLDTSITSAEASNTYGSYTYDGKELVENTSTGLLEDGATSIPAGDIRTFYAHNATLQHPSIQGASAESDLSNYIMDTSGQARKFLTDAPTDAALNKRYMNVENDEEVFLQYIADFDSVTAMRIITFDSSGSNLNTYDNAISESGIKRYISRCSYTYFAGLHAGFVTDFAGTAVGYKVKMIDALTNSWSEAFAFKVVEPCARKKTRLHWINDLGSWDAWTFYGHPVTRHQVKGQTFSEALDTPFSNVSHEEGGATVLSRTAMQSVDTTAHSLTAGELTFLGGLLRSPLVMVEDSSGNFSKVVVKSGRFIVENKQKNLHKLNVSLEYSNKLEGLRN